MKTVLTALGCALTLLPVLGCTQAELYRTTQGWAQQECRKLPDPAERSRCEKSNAASYEQYRAGQQAAQGTGPRP